ncbi:unnamed protein product [Rhizoctonia solani]|uniref:Uncharacterized protein n=1 Tax=Rhizoctonia solani TaxID=456999 RepID=A0A8H3D6T7_9AGAM|nr:unnamed protein product [Rhizoctonia solani]
MGLNKEMPPRGLPSLPSLPEASGSFAQLADECGRLNAILAGEENFESQAILQLAATSTEQQLLSLMVYPYGLRPDGGVRLADKNSTRFLPHVHVNGIRYGTDVHRRAYNSRYAYTNPERHPVLIRRIYQATLPVQGGTREVICAVVQRFQPPAEQPGFPWDDWGISLRSQLGNSKNLTNLR